MTASDRVPTASAAVAHTRAVTASRVPTVGRDADAVTGKARRTPICATFSGTRSHEVGHV